MGDCNLSGKPQDAQQFDSPDWNATAHGRSTFRLDGSRDEDGESASFALR